MTKKEIEQYIINGLTEKISENEFAITEVSLKGERFAEFVYKNDEVSYYWTIIFNNYGKIEVYLSIYYDAISKLYKQLSKELNGGSNFVFSVRFNSYLHPKNADSYYNTSEYLENPYKQEIQEGKNLDEVIEKLYKMYFLSCVPELISKTNSLKKADELINSIPFKFDKDGDPKILVFSSSLVVQMLNGILIAKECNNHHYDKIREVYLKCANRLDNGNILEIDLMREAIEKFKSDDNK